SDQPRTRAGGSIAGAGLRRCGHHLRRGDPGGDCGPHSARRPRQGGRLGTRCDHRAGRGGGSRWTSCPLETHGRVLLVTIDHAHPHVVTMATLAPSLTLRAVLSRAASVAGFDRSAHITSGLTPAAKAFAAVTAARTAPGTTLLVVPTDKDVESTTTDAR